MLARSAFAFLLTASSLWAPTVHAMALQELFSTDMVGVRLAFLEHHLGPARESFTYDGRDRRLYVVEGCRVWVRVHQQTVLGYEVRLSPRCTVSLAEIVQQPVRTTVEMRFDDLPIRAVFAHCVYLCGNAADPMVYGYVPGVRATQDIDVRLGVELSTDPALVAADTWIARMRRQHGDAFVIEGRYNCVDTEQASGIAAFRGVQITTVAIGRGLLNEDFASGRRRLCQPNRRR